MRYRRGQSAQLASFAGVTRTSLRGTLPKSNPSCSCTRPRLRKDTDSAATRTHRQDVDMEIWHNPRCSKSRAAKQALDDSGVEYVELRYLDDSPSVTELVEVLEKMGAEPWDIARTADVRAAGFDALSRDRGAWLEVLAANPALIERPIVIDGDR